MLFLFDDVPQAMAIIAIGLIQSCLSVAQERHKLHVRNNKENTVSDEKPIQILFIPSLTEADVSLYPFSSFGKLVNKDKSGVEHCCTGAYIHEGIVLTAAQCVVDRRNHVFYQQYRNGEGIEKRVRRVNFLEAFRGPATPNLAYDYALLEMEDPSSGGFLETGMTLDHINDTWTVVGYAGDGEVLRKVDAVGQPSGRDQAEAHLFHPLDGPCTGGGPWLAQRGDGKIVVVGLSSPRAEPGKSKGSSSRHTEL